MADKPRPELSDDDDPLDMFTSEGGESPFAEENDPAFSADADTYASFEPAARRTAADWIAVDRAAAWNGDAGGASRRTPPPVAPSVVTGAGKSLTSAGPWAVVLSAGAVVVVLLSIPLLLDRLNDDAVHARVPGDANDDNLSGTGSSAAQAASTATTATSGLNDAPSGPPAAVVTPPVDDRADARTPAVQQPNAPAGTVLADGRERTGTAIDPRSRESSVAMATSRGPGFPTFPARNDSPPVRNDTPPLPSASAPSVPPSGPSATGAAAIGASATGASTTVPPSTGAPAISANAPALASTTVASTAVAPAAPPPVAPTDRPTATSTEREEVARATPPPAAAAPAAAVIQPRPRRDLVQSALYSYRDAINARDAMATRAVLPSVNMDAISKLFAETPQKLTFDQCTVKSVVGAKAEASCEGKVTYLPVGQSKEVTKKQSWTFNLIEIKDNWQIDKIAIR